MNNCTWRQYILLSTAFLMLAAAPLAQNNSITITGQSGPGKEKPILVSLSGFTGEAVQVLQFDLYVQGFAFTNAEGAQYLISGSNNGNLQGRATDRLNKSSVISKSYSGASLRRQAHTFVAEFIQAIGRKAIPPQSQIAFKGENGPNSEIYVADFDGHNAQGVTKDNSIVAAPSWAHSRLALYYTSYKLNHPDIFYQNISTGERKVFSRYGG